jgi:hypothetical protein
MNTINIHQSPSPLGRYAEDATDESVAARHKVEKIATSASVPEARTNGLLGVDAFSEIMPEPEPPHDLPAAVNTMSRTLASMNTDQGVMDMYSVMQLIAVTAQSQRTAARETRESDYRAQTDLQYAAAAEVRKGAYIRLVSGIVNAALQIGGGAMMVAGAFGKPAIDGEILSTQDTVLNLIGGLGKNVGEFGKALDSIGGSAAGIFADAPKAELEAAASRRGQMANQANEIMDTMYQSVRDALEKLKSIESSRQDTNRSISRNV